MQTFLPYADFKKSAECLDYRRLGKQRVEAMQIINLLEKHDAGEDISKLPWGNHPAVKMWIGCTYSLKMYYNYILKEWIDRGYKNNMEYYTDIKGLENYKSYDGKRQFPKHIQAVELPNWFGRKDFHDAHKSNLLRKDKEFYGKYNWDVPDDLPYVWR